MRTETTETIIRCDRCGRQGNPGFTGRTKRRLFSPTLRTSDQVPLIGMFRGWYLGRKWHWCPVCAVIDDKKPSTGKSKVINLNEQREAV